MTETTTRETALQLWKQGQRAQISGDLESAVELYTRSIATHPTPEAYTFRGWAYSQRGRMSEAIAECEVAINLDPEFGNPYNDIGAYLLRQGKLDDAIPWLERAKRASRYEPRHFPCMNLGRIYMNKGMLIRAAQEFDEALALEPGEPTCQAALSRIRCHLH